MSDSPKPLSRLAEELVADLRKIEGQEEPTHNLEGRRSRQTVRETQSFPNVLEQLLQKYQIGRSGPEETIREHWAEIVGPANVGYSHPVAIDRHRLTVLVSSSVVRDVLFWKKEEIVARIQKLPGCAEVKWLNLRSG